MTFSVLPVTFYKTPLELLRRVLDFSQVITVYVAQRGKTGEVSGLVLWCSPETQEASALGVLTIMENSIN